MTVLRRLQLKLVSRAASTESAEDSGRLPERVLQTRRFELRRCRAGFNFNL